MDAIPGAALKFWIILPIVSLDYSLVYIYIFIFKYLYLSFDKKERFGELLSVMYQDSLFLASKFLKDRIILGLS